MCSFIVMFADGKESRTALAPNEQIPESLKSDTHRVDRCNTNE